MTGSDDLMHLAGEGYLPADVDVTGGAVSLARLAHSGFREVWYGDTAAEKTAENIRRIPFQSFIDQFADRRSGERLRLIAHTSRCGSTLLANLLGLRPSTMVLKEPDFITVPAREIVLAADAAGARKFSSLLRALVNFTCHAASAAGRAPVIKISSWTTPVLIGELHGDASWLFLWREPEKVVASNRAKHPSWGKGTEEGRAAARLTGVAGIEPGSVEFYARTWDGIVGAFLAADGLGHRRTLRYRDLADDKETALLSAESWFGLTRAGALPEDFDQEVRRYSKGSGREVFEPAGTHLRDPLDPAEADRVRAVTGPALTALLGAGDHRLF